MLRNQRESNKQSICVNEVNSIIQDTQRCKKVLKGLLKKFARGESKINLFENVRMKPNMPLRKTHTNKGL